MRTDRTKIDADHRDVTVQGVLKRRRPGRGEARPLAGFPVDLDVRSRAQATPATDAQGRFSASVTLEGAAEVRAVYRYRSDHTEVLDGEAPGTRIDVRQTPTPWTSVRTSAAVVDLGGPVTVTAKLERRTSKGWEPFVGRHGATLFARGAAGSGPSEWLGESAGTSCSSTGQGTRTRSQPSSAPGASRSKCGTRAHSPASAPPARTPGWCTSKGRWSSRPPSRRRPAWADAATVEVQWSGAGHAFSVDVAKNGAGWLRARFALPAGYRTATTAAVQIGG
ncbi:hypothetical protein [Streptomyces sp. cmx-4-9]|uniref:hypothetical protein n=1 Tax=Streptomyces sp. cmx-4-9 TaxID=2790941 RepID=UPI003980C845